MKVLGILTILHIIYYIAIWDNVFSILQALLTINSLYGFLSPLLSSILSNSISGSNVFSILQALLTINSLYGFLSPLLSSILSNSISGSSSSLIVSLLIKLPNSTFMYIKSVCQGIKQFPSLLPFLQSFILLTFPPNF